MRIRTVDVKTITRRENPRGGVHTRSFDRCVRAVKKKGGAANPYAVCSSSLGARAIARSHRRPARPASPQERQWVILASRPGEAAKIYEGDRFSRYSPLNTHRAVKFPSRELAVRFARHLKRMFSRTLARWRLKVDRAP